MAEPTIRAGRATVAPDAKFGKGVVIDADEVVIGPGSRIGFSEADDFRTPPGVHIRAQRLVLGEGVRIGRAVRIDGGEIRLDEGVRIERHSTIRVLDRLRIGAHGTVGEGCEISGRQVDIGQELWMLPQAKIGGGSAFENPSRLEAGHFLHLGMHTLVNTARPVRIGHEVGLGTRTSVYTHGAYASRLMGFPVAFDGVAIGDFTWVPGAVINPGVRIGRNCVIGVNSLVTSSIPDGALAAGSPAKVIREHAYPRPLTEEQWLAFFEEFLRDYARVLGCEPAVSRAGRTVVLHSPEATYAAAFRLDELPAALSEAPARVLAIGSGAGAVAAPGATAFMTDGRRIVGAADALSERLANQLRRYGIRFYSRAVGEDYADWMDQPPRFEDEP